MYSGLMSMGSILLSSRNHPGEVWEMRGHCTPEETRVEWRVVLPELGLEDCVMLVMCFHRGNRDTDYRVLSFDYLVSL